MLSRYLNSALLLRMPTATPVGNLVTLQATRFGCVYTMGFLRRASPYLNDGYDGVLLSVDDSVRSIDDCCDVCTRVETCTGCQVGNNSCHLVRDWQPGESVVGKTSITSTKRTGFRSRNGCRCQPTLNPATDAFATCYQPGTDLVSPLRCAISPTDSCLLSAANATWDYCNGTFGSYISRLGVLSLITC